MTTEKKRPNVSRCKGVKKPEMMLEPSELEGTPYTGNTQAELTGVENKSRVIPTHYLLECFIQNIKKGYHKLETKAQTDKNWLSIFKGERLPNDLTPEQYKLWVKYCVPPTVNNFEYSFSNAPYDPVHFSVTQDNKTYGFRRHDTGEYCNFTIIKRGNKFTYNLKPTDDLIIPEWVGG